MLNNVFNCIVRGDGGNPSSPEFLYCTFKSFFFITPLYFITF